LACILYIGRFDVNNPSMVCNNCSCVSSLTLEDMLENGYWSASPNNLTTLFCYIVLSSGYSDVSNLSYTSWWRSGHMAFRIKYILVLLPLMYWTLFAQNLFFTWDIFQKRMPGCSETSFVKSLEDISIAKGRVLNFSCYVLCDATVDETVPIVLVIL
jgi:hypothetical protein